MGPTVMRMMEERIPTKNRNELSSSIEDLAGLTERALFDGPNPQTLVVLPPKLRFQYVGELLARRLPNMDAAASRKIRAEVDPGVSVFDERFVLA